MDALPAKTFWHVGQITGTILTSRSFKTAHGPARRLLARLRAKNSDN
jgi:hypothetical protein